MLNNIIGSSYAECRYAECRYAECRYAECRYAECRYAECRYAKRHGAIFKTICNFKANRGQYYKYLDTRNWRSKLDRPSTILAEQN
jgi:hypothetical protein